MVNGMKTMSTFAARKTPPAGQQLPLDAFAPSGPAIIVDDRETSSRVVERLSSMGIPMELRRLEVGDYAIGDRIIVERKTTRDFLDTLVNRDLLGQLRTLVETAMRPVLIVEGGDLYAERNIHPNAIRGTLAAIAIDMGIACFFTRDDGETAEMLAVLARREDDHSPGERKVHPHKSYRSVREQQENIVAAFPGVGLRSARLLLADLGSIQGIVDADTQKLVAIKGIGEKTAESVHDLARRSYQ
jgi:Fanconi anemia group M protein